MQDYFSRRRPRTRELLQSVVKVLRDAEAAANGGGDGDGATVDTGLMKFGAILGDRASTGCNAVLNPGTVLGQDVLVYACVALRGSPARAPSSATSTSPAGRCMMSMCATGSTASSITGWPSAGPGEASTRHLPFLAFRWTVKAWVTLADCDADCIAICHSCKLQIDI